MTLVGAPATSQAAAARPSPAWAVLVPTATIVVILAAALLPLLTPLVMHPLLTAAQAHLWLGTTPAVAHALSDATVRDLLLGGSFLIDGPDGSVTFGADEVAHLRDARMLLWLLLAAASVAVVGLAARLIAGRDRSGTWRGIARGGAVAAIGTVVIGVVGLVAFGPLFELFHRVFFPGGNWAFDVASQRLVQLYPFAFWELAAAALGIGVVLLGTGTWFLGRAMERRATGRPVAA